MWALAVNIPAGGFDGADGRWRAPQIVCSIFAHDNKSIVNQWLE